jgi:tetratricopeptide (TPR) repeat protein
MSKPSQTNSGYRYPGTRPFYDNEIDRCLFFGREHEKYDLLHKVLANRLVVLFSMSGLGKTSLINAGLNQALRDKKCVPLMIRLNDPEIDPIQGIYVGIEKIVNEKKLDYGGNTKNTLWEYFKTATFWGPGNKLQKPVLILDQFEDFFRLYPPERRKPFIKQLADLVNDNIPDEVFDAVKPGELFHYSDRPPNVRILISIREDCLAHLEEMAADIPGILDNRFRLLPLSREQARRAIVQPSQVSHELIRAAPFSFSREAVEMMLDFLSQQRDMGKIKKTDEVESFQLQLLCRYIEEHKVREKAAVGNVDIIIEPGDLGGEKGMNWVLQRFFDDVLNKFDPGETQNRIRRLCVKGLIRYTKQGQCYRVSLEERAIKEDFNVTENLLAQLVDSWLLRSEPRVKSVYYELIHDTLINPIRKSQEKYENYSRVKSYEDYKKLSLLCIDKNEPGKAVEIYRQAIEVDPGYADIYEEIADTLKEKGKEKLALEIYECASGSGSKEASLYISLGYDYQRLKKYNEAIKVFQKAIELDPENISAKTSLAEEYLLVKDFEKAYSITTGLLKEKNIPEGEKLALHFISILSLLFQGEKNEAEAQLKTLDQFCESLAGNSDKYWDYDEMEKLIQRYKELLEPLTQRLLALIQMLESLKKQGG